MFVFHCDAPSEERKYSVPLSSVCERKDEVHLFIFSLSVNGSNTGICLLGRSILGCPRTCIYIYIYVYASTISSSFNYKVNEILDDFFSIRKINNGKEKIGLLDL
jgi:hypothetical protein